MTLTDLLRPYKSYTKKGVTYAALAGIAHAVISTFLLNHFSGVVGESVIWIPAGIGLAVMLTLGWQYWPFIFVGATLGEMGGGHHLGMAMLLASGALIGYFIVVLLLLRYFKFDKRIQSLGDYARLLVASFIGAAISTTINIFFLVQGGLLVTGVVAGVYQKWFVGDFFGFAFFAPILLVLTEPWMHHWPKEKIIRFSLYLLLALLFGQAVFFGWFREYFDLTGRGFAALFIIALFGYQFGRQGAMLYFCFLLLQSVLSVFYGDAFFDRQLMTHHAPMVIWAYLGIACFVGLAIGLVVESFERKNRELTKAAKDIRDSESRFRDIVGNTPVLMASYSLSTYIMDYVNPFFTKDLGYTTEDLQQPNAWWALAYPDRDYRKEVESKWGSRIEEASKTGSPFVPIETYTTCKDGHVRLISWGSFFASDRMIIYGIDITEQKSAEDLLKVTSAVYRAMGEAVVICDARNNILLANDAFRSLTDYSENELIGYEFSDFLVKRHGARSYSDIFTSLDAVGRWEGQAWFKVKEGEEQLHFLSIYSTFDVDGMPLQRVALISEVTDQRRARELIAQQANFDPLTGLPNRRLMLDRLDQLIKQSARLKTNLAVIYLDLDNFKDVNDSRGHDFGDEILKAASLRLRSEVRDTDTVARIGGDEFVILLGQIDRSEKVDMVVRQIIKSMSDPFPVNNQMVYLTVSLGVSIFPEDGQDGKTLLLNADQAMYVAKSNGKNGSQYFTSAMQIKANYRANMIAELRNAIEKKQFKLEYQPIIDLQTGAMSHAEALLRWHRPNGEIVMPSEFIDIAEESGLILPIGNWVIKEVLLFIRMLGIHQAPAISINVAASQFSSTDHSVIEWVDWITEAGVAPDKIIFEITERMMLTQSQRVMKKIAILQEAGCQFGLDDFGTGYSSIVLLKNFNFDYLKIDSHFIASLTSESLDASLVSAMISMAKGLGLGSIAEGVETEGQADILRSMGCQYVQGHLFSKSLTPEDFRRKYFQ